MAEWLKFRRVASEWPTELLEHFLLDWWEQLSGTLEKGCCFPSTEAQHLAVTELALNVSIYSKFYSVKCETLSNRAVTFVNNLDCLNSSLLWTIRTKAANSCSYLLYIHYFPLCNCFHVFFLNHRDNHSSFSLPPSWRKTGKGEGRSSSGGEGAPTW